jgi:cytidylate kinase
VARRLHYIYVDTGAMYRTLAWYCLQKRVDLHSEKAIYNACRMWKTSLECIDHQVHLLVEGYYPAKEMRTSETSAAVVFIAAVPKVRAWMKKTQRECIKFGDLVMEGRDIGTNVFPETDFKFFLDASIHVRSKRRAAEGVNENLAERDRRDSERATSPLMIALGAMIINNTGQTIDETADIIIAEIEKRRAARKPHPVAP